MSKTAVILLIFNFRVIMSIFNPTVCRLYETKMSVFATSILFELDPIMEIDEIKLQCSKLTNDRDITEFNSIEYSDEDIESVINNADGTDVIVISGLEQGSLYHCRCLSNKVSEKFAFISDIISVSTKVRVLESPYMQTSPQYTLDESILKIEWKALGQDVTNVSIQVSGNIPPNWDDNEYLTEGKPAEIFNYEINTNDFNDGEFYQFRIKFSNQKGTNYSDVLSFITPYIYIDNIEVRGQCEMSEITPEFHSNIYYYSVLVTDYCESISFGVTPIGNIFYITRYILSNNTDNGTIINVDIPDDELLYDGDTIVDDEEEFKVNLNIDGTTSLDDIDNDIQDMETTDDEIDTDPAVNDEDVELEVEDEFEQQTQETRDANVKNDFTPEDPVLDPETQQMDIGPLGSTTKFEIRSGSKIIYVVYVIRSESPIGIPKYQDIDVDGTENPCPKQKRITLVCIYIW